MRVRTVLIKDRINFKPRPADYLRLRYWWLHELYVLRAKRKNGSASKRDIKIAQRELARIRREYV